MRPERADLKAERAELRPERAELRPKKVDLRSERADSSPRSPKGNTWSAIPAALLCMVVNWNERQGSGSKGDKVLWNTGDFHSFVRPSRDRDRDRDGQSKTDWC